MLQGAFDNTRMVVKCLQILFLEAQPRNDQRIKHFAVIIRPHHPQAAVHTLVSLRGSVC